MRLRSMTATTTRSRPEISAFAGTPAESGPHAPPGANPAPARGPVDAESSEPTGSRFVAERSVEAPAPPVEGEKPSRFRAWLTRPRRILYAICAIWILTILDLMLTLQEWGTSHFIELNPL